VSQREPLDNVGNWDTLHKGDICLQHSCKTVSQPGKINGMNIRENENESNDQNTDLTFS
jgi:hypothetical protein